MKKASILLGVIVITIVQSLGQIKDFSINPLVASWSKVLLLNLGSVEIPDNMEIQNGTYKKLAESLYEINSLEYPSIAFQQKGLNDFNTNTSNSYGYARVLITTSKGKYGDYPEMVSVTQKELNEFNQSQDIREIDRNFYKEALQAIQNMEGMKLIKWNSVKMHQVNGIPYLQVSYVRQLNQRPQVIVNQNYFYNNDRYHRITISYQIEKEVYWKPYMDKVVQSFKVTNIR
jgi:hypothetical protein